MGRYSYDDMPPEGYRERRESGKRGTFVIAFAGILLTLIAIIIYLMYTPLDAATQQEDEESPEAVSETAVAEEVAEEAPIIIEDITAPVAEAETAAEPVVSSVQKMGVSEYSVSEGDTLLSIAEAFGIDASTIKEFNDLDDVTVVPGEILEIPQYTGVLYAVKPGDSLESIIKSYNPELSENDLAALNGLTTTEVAAGERIFIPKVGSSITRDNRFSSPVTDGRVVKHNGEYYMDKGETIDGIVIAAEPGEAVLAASDGTVSRVGMTGERRRFIEIESDGGYSTVYMDVESPLVRTGSQVEQGSIIAMIGSSSRYYGEPAMLFSIRQSGVSIDPEDMIEF